MPLSEAAVHAALTTFARAFRRKKVESDLVVLYHGALAEHTDDARLGLATNELLQNEDSFPTIATVLRYCHGQGPKHHAENAYIHGTTISFRDYVRDHALAEGIGGFWRDADEQRRYELAAHTVPRSAYPKLPLHDYLRAIGEVADGLKPKPPEEHGVPKPEPSDADRPNRTARKTIPDTKWKVPF